MRPTLIIAAGFAVVLSLSGPASAQANRTFVSGLGSDSDPCSLTAPCRSFAGAITKTNAGGEIVVLDSAGYGSVTITKSISINAPDGIEGGVTTSSAVDGITVNVGASDVVNLRGLTLVGSGAGANGIVFVGTGALNIQNCVIRGFTLDGVFFRPTGTAALNVSDTIASNNGGNGVSMQTLSSGTVTGVFSRVQATGNGNNAGFAINGTNSTGAVDVTIANSVASNNSVGISSQSVNVSSATTKVMVVNSVVANNSTGISGIGGNSETYLTKNTIAGSTMAFSVSLSGQLFSFGDNNIKSNVNDGQTITLVATK